MELTRFNVARVLDGEGVTKGVAFLVCGDGDHVVTCAHVVTAALGSKPAGSGASAGPRLLFSHGDQGTPFATTIVAFDEVRDLCALQVAVTPGALGVGLILELERPIAGQTAQAVGFPANVDRPVQETDIRVDGEVFTKDGPRLQLTSRKITGGFSGGPLFDARTGRVVGVVTEILDVDAFGRLADLAYAVPISVLLEVLTLPTIAKGWVNGVVKRVAEISNAFPSTFKRLTTIDAQLASQDIPFLMQVQEFLTGAKPAQAFEAGVLLDQQRAQSGSFSIRSLAHRMRDRGIAVFLGGRFCVEVGLSLSPEQLAAQLSAELSKRNGIAQASDVASLPRVCHDWELWEGRATLRLELLRALASSSPANGSALSDVAATFAAAKEFLALTTSYDAFLEQTLSRGRQRVQVVAQESYPDSTSEQRSSGDERSGMLHLLTLEDSERQKRSTATNLSVLRPIENGYALVYRICGGVSFELALREPTVEEPSDTLVLSDPDFFDFAQRAERALPDYIIKHLKNKSVLFLGCDLSQWEECMILHSVLRHLKGTKEKLYAVRQDGGLHEEKFWSNAGVTLVADELSSFLRVLRANLGP